LAKSLLTMARNFRSIGQRSREILRVLTRHGFGYLVERANLPARLPFFRQFKKRKEFVPEESPRQMAAHLRAALEELGPTFVKFGQIISNRPDLLPQAFLEELRKLQDRVEPFDYSSAHKIVEQELKRPIKEIFKQFEEKPLASGSIAQIHPALLADGTPVVVKIKRPGIEKVVGTDILVLGKLAQLAERHIAELRPFRPKMIVDEFENAILREMDFLGEASYTERFREDFSKWKDVFTPRVFWDYTTSNILTMERISGVKISEFQALEELGVDKKALARRLFSAFLHQYFSTGFFHADPHPGNLFVLEGGKLGIVDFGMVGHLRFEMRAALSRAFLALAQTDAEGLAEVYTDLGAFAPGGDISRLRSELLQLMDKYYGMPIGRVDMREIFFESLNIARRHKLRLPRELVLLGRSFTTILSLARSLDPELDAADVARPYARKLMFEKISPSYIAESLESSLAEIGTTLWRLPRQLKFFLKRLSRGEFQISISHTGLEKLITELDRASNRLAFSVVIAAIVIASSIVIAAKVGPLVYENVSLLGVVGYLFAAVLGIWLVIGIVRSGRL